MPVPLDQVPRARSQMKPDWSADELGEDNSTFYVSERALGYLYRDIQLPPSVQQRRLVGSAKVMPVNQVMAALRDGIAISSDPLAKAVHNLAHTIVPNLSTSAPRQEEVADILRIFRHYIMDLKHLCQHNTLTLSKRTQLTEEEIVAGTIVAKTSHHRRRHDAILQLNDQSAAVAKTVLDDISGDDDVTNECWVRRAWLAWQITILHDCSGSRSFSYLSLVSLFDAEKELLKQTPLR